MQKSARMLGLEYGLTAEEMNRVLAKRGFLEGDPGDYSLTEKAREYAEEEDHHRGCGGYSIYNRYWTTRTYDESIREVLNVTDELKDEVRAELAAVRAARKAARLADQAEAAAYWAKQNIEETSKETAEVAPELVLDYNETLKKAGVIGLATAGVVAGGYLIYRSVIRVKRWWKDRKHSDQDNREEE